MTKYYIIRWDATPSIEIEDETQLGEPNYDGQNESIVEIVNNQDILFVNYLKREWAITAYANRHSEISTQLGYTGRMSYAEESKIKDWELIPENDKKAIFVFTPFRVENKMAYLTLEDSIYDSSI